jgi:hypothetical protein
LPVNPRSAEKTESIRKLGYEITKESDISWKSEEVEPYLITTILLAMQKSEGWGQRERR